MQFDNIQDKFRRCAEFTWSEKEQAADQWFQELKLQEQEHICSDFFQKDTMKHFKVMKSFRSYQLMDRMPKGVLHHVHGACMDDMDFIKKYALNYPGVYVSKDMSNWHYGTAEEARANEWITPAHARTLFMSEESFERALANMSQFLPEEAAKYSYCQKVWDIFEAKIKAFLPLYYQEDLYRDYIKHLADVFVQNGFHRIELKIILFDMKRRNPTERLSVKEVIKLTEDTEREIQKKYPFFTLGLIPFGLKLMTEHQLEDYIRLAYEIESPLIVGLDMANQQDKYPEFDRYEKVIARVENEFKGRKKLPGAYHAGETSNIHNHNVSKVIKFGSVRIGHGLNLFQHSYLIPTVVAKQICVEVCPISNQFLGYVYNLTQHPAIAFYNLGIPISISSDDPGKFGYSGVTPDFFVAAHAFGFGLKDFKLIGLYTIRHALCDQQLKRELYRHFEKDWSIFINTIHHWSKA